MNKFLTKITTIIKVFSSYSLFFLLCACSPENKDNTLGKSIYTSEDKDSTLEKSLVPLKTDNYHKEIKDGLVIWIQNFNLLRKKRNLLKLIANALS